MRNARDIIEAYWTACGARDWPAFGTLLADDIIYELPQSRERIRGREPYVRFNAEYPGDWTIHVDSVVGEERRAVSRITFAIGEDRQTGICFFDLDPTGLIARITDFWPEPFEPPPGREHLVERY